MAIAKPKQSSKTKITVKKPRRVGAVRARISRHYYTYMPNKKHHRVLIWVVFWFVAVVIAGQMLYPPGRALPLARLGDRWVGWIDETTLMGDIGKTFMTTKLKLAVTDGPSLTETLASTGAEPRTDAMSAQLTDYPFWQRFVPLSILVHWPHVTMFDVTYEDSVLETFAQTASQKLSQPPSNARLAIVDGEVIATSDMAGSAVAPQAVVSAIKQLTPPLGRTMTVAITAKRQPAATTSADFAPVRSQAEAALSRPVTIAVGSQTFTPDRGEVASWLVIGEDGHHRPVLSFDRGKAGNYLDELNKKVGTPAGQTNIQLVNGRETSRQIGATGQAIDQKPLLALMSSWILDGEGSPMLYGELVDVAPSVIYNHKYTSSQAGLRAYVADAARDQNANIVVQQVTGDHWSANAYGDMSIPSASTYKLFVALILFDKMDKGQVHWNDPILDTDVSTCFDRMTIASTNPCPREWLRQWGRDWTNQYVWSHGFSHGTTFTDPVAVHSTANDLTKFMIGLENCTLICGPHRDRLLHSLSTHPYRYGIPTGSSGQVWDKVGFLWDYVHDTAIVYTPKGHYVMTIMTKGRSYATIANITREIEKIMYP